MSAIFISHSSHDDTAAIEIRQWLEGQGHHSLFLDFDPDNGIPPGRDWEQELYRQLRACQAIIVLCSERSMASKWCFVEIAHGKALGKYIFPIKVTPCRIDRHLSAFQIVDLARDKEKAFKCLARGLLAAGLDAADAFDWAGNRSPYPGLTAFQEEDAAVFFGRSVEIRQGLEILRRLRSLPGERMQIVLGASGSGKSSLVRAGLIPRLRRSPEEWLVVPAFRPHEDPLRELAGALSAAFEEHGQELEWRRIRGGLKRAAEAEDEGGRFLDELALDLQVAAGRREATVLLVIDQMEELLGYGTDTSPEQCLALLRSVLKTPARRVMALCTLRSDFFGDLLHHPSFRGLEFEDLRLAQMTRDQLVQVIERPAEVAGLELESGLTAAIIEDLETNDALPLLAFSLRELYERYGEDGRLMIDEYRQELGGLSGLVTRTAELAFTAGSAPGEREASLRHAFLLMIRLDEEGKFRRQSARWIDLPESAYRLLEHFVQARLLVASGEGDDRILEIAHEALFRSWGRLRHWLDEDREFLLWRKRLATDLEKWERIGPDPSVALRGPALEEGRRWLEHRVDQLTPDESAFLEMSVRLANRQRTQAIGLLNLAALFLVVVAVTGIWLWQRAESQRERAEQASELVRAEKERAEDVARVAVAYEWTEQDPTEAALVLSEVRRPDKTEGAVAKIHNSLRHPLAVWAFDGDRARIFHAAWSPDGERIVAASEDGKARIWCLRGSDDPILLKGHQGLIWYAAFSSDGEHVITASHDNTARIWRTDGAGEPVVLKGHEGPVRWAAWHPLGKRVVTTSYDATARIWNVDGSGVSVVLEGHERRVWSVAWSSTGNRVVTASDDRTARIWRTDSFSDPIVLEGHEDSVRWASFSPDGESVLTASYDGTARVWSADGSGEPVVFQIQESPSEAPQREWVTLATFSPDGERVVTASEYGKVQVWRTDGSEEPILLQGYDSSVDWAAWSPDGKRIVTASRDWTARIWRADGTGKPAFLKGHSDSVRTASFSPDGIHVLTASFDGTARVWATDRVEPIVFGEEGGELNSVDYSPDGGRIVATSNQLRAMVWNIKDPTEPVIFQAPRQEGFWSAAFHPDGEHIVLIATRGHVQIRNADGSGEPRVFQGHRRWVWSAAFDASGDRFLTASIDGTARIWRTDGSGEPVVLQSNDGRVVSATWSPTCDRVLIVSEKGPARVWRSDGSGEPVTLGEQRDTSRFANWSAEGDRVAVVGNDGRVRIWKADGSAASVVLQYPTRYSSAWFSPNGEHLVTSAMGSLVQVWGADGSGAPISLQWGKESVEFVAFSPDGTRVMTRSGGGTALIWRIDGFGEPIVLHGHEKRISAASFNPTGDQVATASSDGTVRIWSLDPAVLFAKVRTATNICLDHGWRERMLGESTDQARLRFEECRDQLTASGPGTDGS